jgi:disulfide oxidoreductase YuzD
MKPTYVNHEKKQYSRYISIKFRITVVDIISAIQMLIVDGIKINKKNVINRIRREHFFYGVGGLDSEYCSEQRIEDMNNVEKKATDIFNKLFPEWIYNENN